MVWRGGWTRWLPEVPADLNFLMILFALWHISMNEKGTQPLQDWLAVKISSKYPNIFKVLMYSFSLDICEGGKNLVKMLVNFAVFTTVFYKSQRKTRSSCSGWCGGICWFMLVFRKQTNKKPETTKSFGPHFFKWHCKGRGISLNISASEFIRQAKKKCLQTDWCQHEITTKRKRKRACHLAKQNTQFVVSFSILMQVSLFSIKETYSVMLMFSIS